jgi:hypothetical protein
MEPSKVLNLSHLTSLGEPDPSAINKHDILSALAFDAKGNHISVGDYGGRCIIFERSKLDSKDDFEYLTEFQAHEKSFDTLSSQEIPDTITQMLWVNTLGGRKVMTSNSLCIKLWNLKEKQNYKVESA